MHNKQHSIDLHIDHDRFGSSPDPSLNGHLHYPNDIDTSLNETADDKIRKYRSEYNNNPPTSVSFMTVVGSTSGRLHSEFVRLLFLQTHRETDRFFETSGVHLPEPSSGFFQFHRVPYSFHLKSRVVLTLTKVAVLRIMLNIDGATITSQSHTHPSHSNFSSINLVFIFRCTSSPNNPVSERIVDSSTLAFSLASLWQTFFTMTMGTQIPVIVEKSLEACNYKKFQLLRFRP